MSEHSTITSFGQEPDGSVGVRVSLGYSWLVADSAS